MNQMFDSKFFYRLRFFILGILLGTLVLWLFYWKDNRKNVYKWPSEIIKENILSYKWEIDPKTLCEFKCLGIDSSIIKRNLDEATINYSMSDVSAFPCKKYTIVSKINEMELSIAYLICSYFIIKINAISPITNCNCPN